MSSKGDYKMYPLMKIILLTGFLASLILFIGSVSFLRIEIKGGSEEQQSCLKENNDDMSKCEYRTNTNLIFYGIIVLAVCGVLVKFNYEIQMANNDSKQRHSERHSKRLSKRHSERHSERQLARTLAEEAMVYIHG